MMMYIPEKEDKSRCRDMMEIGNGDLTIQEQRTHFAAWAFLKSPILLGTNVGHR